MKQVVDKKTINRKVRDYLICEKCENQISRESNVCTQCGSTAFLPDFVLKRRAITQNFSINVMDAYDSKSKVLNFYKWFPGKRWSININSQIHWQKIKQVIDEELGPFMGWDSKLEVDKELDRYINDKGKSVGNVETTEKLPKILLEVVKSIDFSGIDSDKHKYVLDGLKTLVDVAGQYDEGFQAIFNGVIRKLPREGKVAIAQLEELLKKWSLKQITGVAALVRERLNEISRFKEAIKNDETFEIRGDNSIHRILERSMWIVDERYLLMQSNETLRKFIGEGLGKKDKKKYGSKRPDFVCGSVDNKLIIMELKRPSHKLVLDDLQQLETYLMVIDDYSDKFKNYEAYLVGKRIDPELKKRLRFRKNTFKVLTFADLIDSTEKRYRDYLKV